ncbi:MAG: ComF family protein [Rhodothermales bacterium]
MSPIRKQLSHQIAQLSAGYLSLLFPTLCPGCNRRLINSAVPVCPACAYKLERVEDAIARMSVCKLPEACDAFHHIFALWMFDKAGTVQNIHQSLKYKNRPTQGLALGKLMGTTFLMPLHPRDKPDVIMPIPLHQRRLLERGYNQSEVLASGISSSSKIPLSTKQLLRSTHTKTQTGFDRTRRLANVRDAFAVAKTKGIQGSHVLLVDDVLTTGATLLAASIPLKKAGASHISVATLALARHL